MFSIWTRVFRIHNFENFIEHGVYLYYTFFCDILVQIFFCSFLAYFILKLWIKMTQFNFCIKMCPRRYYNRLILGVSSKHLLCWILKFRFVYIKITSNDENNFIFNTKFYRNLVKFQIHTNATFEVSIFVQNALELCI